MAETRRRVLAAALAIGGALIAGCQGGKRFDADHPMAGSPVRTDLEPMREQFPRLAGMVSAHWQAVAVGADSWAPGPSDLLIQAIVVLRESDLAPVFADYHWSPPPEERWDTVVSDELLPFVPASGYWQWDPWFEGEVIPDDYHGWVYVDLRSYTVYLSIHTM